MLGRRRLLIGASAFLCAQPLVGAPNPTPPGASLGFNVLRKGSVIGTHRITFDTPAPALLVVRVAVDLGVGIGPIKFFRYTHRATETWRDGQVMSVEAETDDNGKKYAMTARRTDAGLAVEGTWAKRYIAPDDALPATHWNRRMLDGPFINTQDGRLMRPTVTPKGEDAIPVASGRQIEAQRFALTGDAVLDTWYDGARVWAGVAFKAGDGSQVRYERL